MNIFLTPELEKIIERQIQTGLYNNASEVIGEALSFMGSSEDLIYQIKLDRLRKKMAEGELDIKENRFTALNKNEISSYFDNIKSRSLDQLNEDSQ
jgi:antitoxin ParD1/3/4